MPRQAHGRPITAASGQTTKRKRKSAKSNRGLDAFEIAEKQFPTGFKIRQHRLGEADDDDDVPATRADASERSSKRRKVDNDLSDDNYAEQGSDSEGNTWHVGVEEDDDDSDLDSDEAFGASDEEKFADFTFRGSRGGRTDREHDDPDQDDSDNDDLGEDAVDLTTAWDMHDEDEKQQKTRKLPRNTSAHDDADKNSSNASQDSDADDESDPSQDLDASFSDEDDEDATPETSTRLRSFVDSLTPAQAATTKSSRDRPQSLPDKPSLFGIRSGGVSAADLMQYVKDPTQRKSLKIMQDAEREEPSNHTDGIAGKLAAPLAKRQQDRLDRVAAYDVSKKTMDRWLDTVKQNRRAEHLSFPLRDDTKASASAVKSFQPIFRAEPQTELETKIQQIMHENGTVKPTENVNYHGDSDREVDSGEQGDYDTLPDRSGSVDEIKARQRERRMQRELMFREEVRSKRLKKIKSKAFRRVRRKEKDKQEAKLRELGVLDSEEERDKNDRKRAEERMGARHRESKWAKGVKTTGQATWNEDARVGVAELARRDDELRQRVQGKTVRASDDSSDASDSESISDSEAEMNHFDETLGKLDDVSGATSKSKLAGMAFMQRAEAARKAENDHELRQIKKSLQDDNHADDSDSNESGSDENQGRQHFGSSKTKKPTLQAIEPAVNDFEEPLSGDEDAESLENGEPTIPPPRPTTKESKPSSKKISPIEVNTIRQKTTRTPNGHTAPSIVKTPASGKTKQRSTALEDYTSPSESEPDANGFDPTQELALDIFAGEDERDALRDFEKEKKQTVVEEGDQVVDNSLPGWGSWTGVGVGKKAQKKNNRFLTTVKGINPDARRDNKLDRVIVNEKRVKKNSKYLATELPHPYESRAQYERALRLPMGPEWSTRGHFQDAIKPRLLLKQGTVIKPVAKPAA